MVHVRCHVGIELCVCVQDQVKGDAHRLDLIQNVADALHSAEATDERILAKRPVRAGYL